MNNLIERAKAIINRYANFEGHENTEETETLLEDAMNIISEFVELNK